MVLPALILSGCGGISTGDVCGSDTHADDHGICVANRDGRGAPDAATDGGATAVDAAPGVDSSIGDARDADSGDPVDFNTACLVDDDIVVVYGPPGNRQHTGFVKLQGGVGWQANSIAEAEDVFITAPNNAWGLHFATTGLGVPMTANVTYSDTKSASSNAAGYPGLTIFGGNGDGTCRVNQDSEGGSFRVIDIDVAAGDGIHGVVHGFTAVFTYPCPATAPIRGCVRVRLP